MKRVQLVRYVGALSDTFTGLEGELSVNTSTRTIRVHDGITEGGFETARADLSNAQEASQSSGGIMTIQHVAELGNATSGIAVNAAAISANAASIASVSDDLGIESSARIASDQSLSASLSDLSTDLSVVDATVASLSVTVADHEALYGVASDTAGHVEIYGDGAGSNVGGILSLHSAADFGSVWQVSAVSDELRVGPSVGDYISVTSTGVFYAGSPLYNSTNDGIGSGLDADLGHGVPFTSYARRDIPESFSGLVTADAGLVANSGRLELHADLTEAGLDIYNLNGTQQGRFGVTSSGQVEVVSYGNDGTTPDTRMSMTSNSFYFNTPGNLGGVYSFSRTFQLGIIDTVRARMFIAGSPAGSSDGGMIELYAPASYDSQIQRWMLESFRDRFEISTDLSTSLALSPGENICVAEQAITISGDWLYKATPAGFHRAGLNTSSDLSPIETELLFNVPAVLTYPAGVRAVEYALRIEIASRNAVEQKQAIIRATYTAAGTAITSDAAIASVVEQVAQSTPVVLLNEISYVTVPLGDDLSCTLLLYTAVGGTQVKAFYTPVRYIH